MAVASTYFEDQIIGCAKYYTCLLQDKPSDIIDQRALRLCEVEANRREHSGEVLDSTLMAYKVMGLDHKKNIDAKSSSRDQ